MTITALRRACLLLVALCLLSAATLSAQFGGLKKKAAQAVGAETGATPAQPGKPAPAPEVTPAVVDHYLAGLKARGEQRDRLAQGNTPAGKYYSAMDAQKAHDRHCEEFNQTRGTEYQRLLAAQKYDSAAAVMQKRDTSCEQGYPSPQEPSFEELSKAQGSQDSAAAGAAGLQVTQWAQLDEWIPLMVNQMVQSPDQNNQALASNFGKKVSEVESLRARQADLAKALGIKGREKKPAPVEMAAPPVAAAASTQPGAAGDPACYQNEMTKNQGAMQAMSARAQEAQKKGDTQKMMALADSISQISTAVMRKCGMVQ
jgi:hypothetical protein